jgi:hypothetical protein
MILETTVVWATEPRRCLKSDAQLDADFGVSGCYITF